MDEDVEVLVDMLTVVLVDELVDVEEDELVVTP